MGARRKRDIAHRPHGGHLKASDERAARWHVRTLAAICAALRDFVPPDAAADWARCPPFISAGAQPVSQASAPVKPLPMMLSICALSDALASHLFFVAPNQQSCRDGAPES